MVGYRRILGILSAVMAYPFIMVSIFLSPWFNFYDNALSDLGNIARNRSVAYVYNSGLIIAGSLVSLFALLISIRYRSWKYLPWSALLMITGVSLALVGVFPEDAGRIHGLVSTVFFFMMALTMLVYSLCAWPLRSSAIAIAAFAFSLASILVWSIEWSWKGVAIQETISSLMASVWLLTVSILVIDSDKTAKG